MTIGYMGSITRKNEIERLEKRIEATEYALFSTVVSVLNNEITNLEGFLESPLCDDNSYYRITEKELPHLKKVRDYFLHKME